MHGFTFAVLSSLSVVLPCSLSPPASLTCSSMPAKAKTTQAKGKTQALVVKKRQGAAKTPQVSALISQQAVGFRNLMRYRASDACKKALCGVCVCVCVHVD